MKGIQIFANGIELQYEHETLTVKTENNAFSTDFKVSHSNFPFLIVENEATRQALGPRNVTSLGKKKVVDVVVFHGGMQYVGQLGILSYLRGFRKCDLKFGTAALQILEKKLADVMPVVSVWGDASPDPYRDELNYELPGAGLWPDFVQDKIGKIYPDVDYTFPFMNWKLKYGEPSDEGSEWPYYRGINVYASSGPFVKNEYTISGDTVNVFNRNVPSAQPFALGILRMAFASIGWTIDGTFTKNNFVRRMLVLSLADNLTRINVTNQATSLTFADFAYAGLFLYRIYRYFFTPEAAGNYVINYDVAEPLRTGTSNGNPATYLAIKHEGTESNIFANYNDANSLHFNGQYTFTVTDEQVGQEIRLEWARHNQMSDELPLTFHLSWQREGQNYYMMHPTVELGRYVPDWNLADYINELKIKFCLDVQFDDLAKVAYFNFAKDILLSPAKFVSTLKPQPSDHEPPAYSGINLTGPEGENAMFITNDAAVVQLAPESDYTQVIESKFFPVPHGGYTANLALAEAKDGTGLMLYDPKEPENPGEVVKPVISAQYNGATPAIEGTRGTYQYYWAEVVRMKLNGSMLSLEAPFTAQQVRQLQRLQKIHINNQEYVILATEEKPTLQDNIMVKLSLQSVNF